MELVALSFLGLLIFAPLAAYFSVRNRYAAQWKYAERLPLPAGGAYRGSWVRRWHDPGAPKIVRVASLVSLLQIAPTVLSIPVLLLGLLDEGDRGEIGPAMVFGPTGLALAIAIFVVGLKLLRRRASAPRFARFVAIWECVHNVAVIGAVVAASSQPESSRAWQSYRVEDIGGVAIVWAALAFVHAGLLLAAAGAHEVAPRTDVAPGEEAEYAIA